MHGQVHAWQKGKQQMKTLTGLAKGSDFAMEGIGRCGEGFDEMLKMAWERVWCGEEDLAVTREEEAASEHEPEDKENGGQPAPARKADVRGRSVLSVIATGEITVEVPEDDAPPSPRRAEPVASSASAASYHPVERKFDIWQSPPSNLSENTKRMWRKMIGRHPGMPM